jgi:hypothetical protein
MLHHFGFKGHCLQARLLVVLDPHSSACVDGVLIVQVRQIVVLNPHGSIAIDWETAMQSARYCVWKPGLHCSNFAFARVDFWHEVLHLECWDEVCKERRRQWWPLHEYDLPRELCGQQAAFQRPPDIEMDTEEMLVYADGSKALSQAIKTYEAAQEPEVSEP